MKNKTWLDLIFLHFGSCLKKFYIRGCNFKHPICFELTLICILFFISFIFIICASSNICIDLFYETSYSKSFNGRCKKIKMPFVGKCFKYFRFSHKAKPLFFLSWCQYIRFSNLSTIQDIKAYYIDVVIIKPSCKTIALKIFFG